MRSGGKGDAIPLLAPQEAPPCGRGASLTYDRLPLWHGLPARDEISWEAPLTLNTVDLR